MTQANDAMAQLSVRAEALVQLTRETALLIHKNNNKLLDIAERLHFSPEEIRRIRGKLEKSYE